MPDRALPPAGQVHIWSADLDSARWPPAEELPAAERERAERILAPRRARRWAAARWAPRRVLGDYLGTAPAEVELTTAGGKPALAAARPPLRFSLSHSRGLALIAVSAGEEVGVDLEWIASRRPDAFYAEWTRREAVAKCFGTGLWAPLPSRPVSVLDVDAGAGYAAALAVAGDQRRPLKRSAGTRQAASAAIARPIFELPARRSRKTIGTSTTSKPRQTAR